MKWQTSRPNPKESVTFTLGNVILQFYTFNPPTWQYDLKAHGFRHGAWWPPGFAKVEVFRHHQTRSAALRKIIREWPKWLDDNPEAAAWVLEELL